jgi:hypothetical protein
MSARLLVAELGVLLQPLEKKIYRLGGNAW